MKMTKAEMNALNNLDAIINKMNTLSDEDFEVISEATTEYEMGDITKAQLNKTCRKYGFTATEAMVYIAVVLS